MITAGSSRVVSLLALLAVDSSANEPDEEQYPERHHGTADWMVTEDDNRSTEEGEADDGVEVYYKGNRFSRFAPDPNLPADEYRMQLRDNIMKANLEERRKNYPNRGNQPAKYYLDSL